MTTTRDVLKGAMPPVRRFWPGAASAFLSEGSAVALLAVSAWLIVRASEQPLVMYITAAVVGVRLFALTRAVFRYTDRLAGHDAALRQLAITRTALVRRLIPLSPDGLAHTRRGSVLERLFRDARCGSLQPATSDVCADWLGASLAGLDPDRDTDVPRW